MAVTVMEIAIMLLQLHPNALPDVRRIADNRMVAKEPVHQQILTLLVNVVIPFLVVVVLTKNVVV